ncbi:MAG: tetratricopeptide repeat protein [Candidatus Manganitrophaceae bacterium]
MFPIAAGTLLTLVVFFLFQPFWRRSNTGMIVGEAAVLDEERIDLQIEKESLLKTLSELEDDRAQGRVLLEDYQRLKLGQEHRLVAVLDRLDLLVGTGPSHSQPKQSKGGSVHPSLFLISTLVLTVGLGAFGVRSLVHWKLERQQLAERGQGAAGMPPVNPVEMVARLEERLKQNPNDLQGQVMAGRSYMTLERWQDAEKAWRKALELDDRNQAAHYGLAEVLIRIADPGDRKAFEEALVHLDKSLIKAPQDPSAHWARGVALVHLERYQEADEAWTEAYKYIPPGTESAEFVKQALQDLRSGRAPLF